MCRVWRLFLLAVEGEGGGGGSWRCAWSGRGDSSATTTRCRGAGWNEQPETAYRTNDWMTQNAISTAKNGEAKHGQNLLDAKRDWVISINWNSLRFGCVKMGFSFGVSSGQCDWCGGCAPAPPVECFAIRWKVENDIWPSRPTLNTHNVARIYSWKWLQRKPH